MRVHKSISSVVAYGASNLASVVTFNRVSSANSEMKAQMRAVKWEPSQSQGSRSQVPPASTHQIQLADVKRMRF